MKLRVNGMNKKYKSSVIVLYSETDEDIARRDRNAESDVLSSAERVRRRKREIYVIGEKPYGHD